jgi:lipopolysaccharide biosynthesis glycosyltransferase
MLEKRNMIVALSCTETWYHYLMVDIYSMLECTKTIKKIYLLIETNNPNDVPYLNKLQEKYKEVEFVLIDLKRYIEENLINSPNVDTIYSNFSFGRLLLPDIVVEDKVLYIDTDAIVRRDISAVWNYNIDDYYLAGVKDYGIFDDNIIEKYNIEGKYVNSGFVVFNLKMIREENIKEQWFNIINNWELTFPDQDALNIVCQHKELYIPSVYNSSEYGGLRITLDPMNKSLIKVYHFAGPKTHWVVDRLYGEEWYDAEEKFIREFYE